MTFSGINVCTAYSVQGIATDSVHLSKRLESLNYSLILYSILLLLVSCFHDVVEELAATDLKKLQQNPLKIFFTHSGIRYFPFLLFEGNYPTLNLN
jgi:hypothetical protein